MFELFFKKGIREEPQSIASCNGIACLIEMGNFLLSNYPEGACCIVRNNPFQAEVNPILSFTSERVIDSTPN